MNGSGKVVGWREVRGEARACSRVNRQAGEIGLDDRIESTQTAYEVFGGAGGYKFYSGQTSCTWIGGRGARFDQLINDCKLEGAVRVLDWFEAWMWSILEGSALAGRPLRIVGPAIPMDTIINCISENSTMGWNAIDRTAAWGNNYQVWFDMHARYLVRGHVEDAVTKLLSGSPYYPDWRLIGPYRTVCLELAPKLKTDLTWWTGGGNAKFNRLMGIPDCDAGNGTWDAFLVGQEGWNQAQFGNEVEFGWGDAVGNLFGQRFTILCYGSTLQWPVIDPPWDLPALRCQNACAENFPNNTPQFSPLKDYYEEAAENYQIENFDPHEDACASCPGN